MAREPSSRRPAGLTPAALAQAALAEVAEVGVHGLTMARVAERLGVRAPSLYHHVRDRQALLRLVAAQALGDVDADVAAYDGVHDLDAWLALTRDGSGRLRRTYLAHPGLAAVVQATADPDREHRPDARGRLVRAQVRALVRLGVPETAAREAFLTCAHWTLAAVAADSARLGSSAPGGRDAAWERGLGWLLAGVLDDLQALLPPAPDGPGATPAVR